MARSAARSARYAGLRARALTSNWRAISRLLCAQSAVDGAQLMAVYRARLCPDGQYQQAARAFVTEIDAALRATIYRAPIRRRDPKPRVS